MYKNLKNIFKNRGITFWETLLVVQRHAHVTFIPVTTIDKQRRMYWKLLRSIKLARRKGTRADHNFNGSRKLIKLFFTPDKSISLPLKMITYPSSYERRKIDVKRMFSRNVGGVFASYSMVASSVGMVADRVIWGGTWVVVNVLSPLANFISWNFWKIKINGFSSHWVF